MGQAFSDKETFAAILGMSKVENDPETARKMYLVARAVEKEIRTVLDLCGVPSYNADTTAQVILDRAKLKGITVANVTVEAKPWLSGIWIMEHGEPILIYNNFEVTKDDRVTYRRFQP